MSEQHERNDHHGSCKQKKRWRTEGDRRRVLRPWRLCTPKNLGELKATIRFAEKHGKQVRAVGSGHSFSDVLETKDCLIDTSKLKRVIDMLDERRDLRENLDVGKYFRVEAGIKVRRLNKKLKKVGKALENMGAYDGQSIAGVMSTATHGSGIKFGPVATSVVSIDLVTTAGKTVRVEPASGITKTRPPSIDELKQDDKAFRAVLVNMGCMGVIYAVTLRVKTSYKLKESRTVRPWNEVRAELLDGSVVGEHQHYELQVSPYTDHSCLVTRRDLHKNGERIKFSERHRSFVSECGGYVSWLTNLVNFTNPQKVAKTITNSLKWQEKKGWYKDISHRVLSLRSLNNFVKLAVGIAFAFPIDKDRSGKRPYLEALDELFCLARDSYDKKETFLSAAIGVRFVASTDAYLAMQNGSLSKGNEVEEGWCLIEFGVLKRLPDAKKILEECSKALLMLGGRPHWGLDLNFLTGPHARVLYPRFNDWYDVYKHFNANGTFNGPFTDRMCISIPARECEDLE